MLGQYLKQALLASFQIHYVVELLKATSDASAKILF
jgi:hypothetical protein